MTMKNREVFQKDPLELRLVNSGVAKVGTTRPPKS